MISRGARALVALLIVLVVVANLRSLYVFPMPDSARWWGDETGQIIELKTELQEGHARIPIGLGSTVGISNGLLRSNSWLAAFLYGEPARLFADAADLVSIGRTVTAVLSLALLLTLYLSARRFGVNDLAAMLAALMLLASRSFLFASHAARLDIAAGLAALITIAYLSRKYQQLREKSWSPTVRWWFIFGVVMLSEATLSIHLLTLLAPVALFAMIKLGAVKNWKFALAALGGVATLAFGLLAVYHFSGAPMTVLGATGEHTQFHSVIEEIPIMKLFSRSAQLSNIVQRWHGMWQEAPAILVAVILALGSLVAFAKRIEFGDAESFVLYSSILLLMAWLLLQSYAIYYYMQILPVVILAAFIVLCKAMELLPRAIVGNIVLAGIAAAVAHFGFYDALNAGAVGQRLTLANVSALEQMVATPGFQQGTPTVVVQNPALAWMLQHTTARVMSPHFLEFPLDRKSPSEVLREQKAEYILLYTDPVDANYALEYAPLKHIADSIGKVSAIATGALFDAGRSYWHRDGSRIDTLRLYKLTW